MKNRINKIESHIIESIQQKTKYGEVFTSLDLVDKILSILPDDFWKNPKLKILDPCNGIGNFPSIIINKLMLGLEEFEPNNEKRYKYIMENIIYVCEIQRNNIEMYIDIFSENDVNLNYHFGSYLDNFFNSKLDEWKIDKFDLIVGNPPYQSGKDSRSSISIYHKFVEKSVRISKLVLMITPSKWYSNPSMSKFRYDMINNYGLKKLVDIKGEVFRDVEIKGGVSYFLLESGYNGNCLYNGQNRKFNNNIISTDDNDIILNKIKEYKKFSSLLNSDQYFGVRNSDKRFQSENTNNSIICHVSSKNGNTKYIKLDEIVIKPTYYKYKVFIPTASGSKNNIGSLGRIVIGNPTDICSRSFVHFAFNTKSECDSFISYINTEVIKKLISLKKQTQLVKKDCFSFVPIVPLDRIWDNKSVLKYLNL